MLRSSFYSLQISTNNLDFKEVIPWKKCAFGESYQQWKESFYWWKWKDRSFLEMIILPEKLFATSIRILMKAPVNTFFGIYEVKVLDKKSLVLIKTMINNDDYCLVNKNDNVAVYDCLDASSFAFNNDLFKITKDFKIQTAIDKKCLTLSNQKPIFNRCHSSKNQKWELSASTNYLGLSNNSNINSNRKMGLSANNNFLVLPNDSNKNTNKCLKATTNPIILELNELNITATSTMNDDQHQPINAFFDINNNNPELCWISSPGTQEVRYIVRFKETPIEKILIKRKYKPKKIRVSFNYSEDYWKDINIDANNNLIEANINVDKLITGFRIIFLESEELFNDLVVYGIDKIKIIAKVRKIETFDCKKNEQYQGNEWKLEELDVKFASENYFGNWKNAPNLLFKKTEKLLKANHALKNLEDPLKLFIETSEKIKNKIDKTMNVYLGFNQKIKNFKENNLQKEVINLVIVNFFYYY